MNRPDRRWEPALDGLSIAELDRLEAALEAGDEVEALEVWLEAAGASLQPLPECRGRRTRGGFYVFDGGLAATPKES